VRFSRDGALGTALLKSAHICEYLPRWRIVEQGKWHSSFVDVTSKLHWRYKEASLELRGSFVGVTGKLHSHALGSFVDVTSKLHWRYKEASLELRGSFIGVTGKSRRCYWEVS
jgi:hypothetical protein